MKFLTGENICIPCRQTLATAFSGENLKQLHKAVCEDSMPRRKEYMDALDLWTTMHNESPKGMVTKRTWNENFDESVAARETSALLVEEMHGFLWPLPLLAKKFPDEKPAKSDLTTVSHGGSTVTGVVKPPDAGWMPGVLRLSSQTSSAVEKKTDLGRASQQLREGQVDSIFKAEVAHLKADVNLQGDDDDDGDASLYIKFKRRRMAASTKDADDADPDNAFAARFSSRIIGSAGNQADKKGAAASSSGGAGVSDTPVAKRARATAGSSSAVAPAEPSPARNLKQLAKRAEERNLFELAVLECEQVLKTASDPSGILSLSVARIKGALTKAERRMQPKAIEARASLQYNNNNNKTASNK